MMPDGEKSPLISLQAHREIGGARLTRSSRRSFVSSCGRCCLASAALPLSLFRRTKSDEGTFSSSLAVLLTCLGSVVGTGNIWRFPRILGTHAEEGGALSFLLVWGAVLWLWSIPVVLIEYGVGRYTRKAVIESWGTLIGPSYRFLGGFPVIVSFCIASYYSVLVGWCGYYVIKMCSSSLPPTLEDSTQIWDSLQGSEWPVLCHAVAILLASLSVSRGVSTIEPVNKVIVPVLLSIVVLCFYWSIFLPYAGNGIIHLFSPSWESLKSSKLWIDAASQNAWDTSAGVGLFLTYATFMKRSHGAVQLGSLTPFFNNIVSLLCGITVFSTVFSTQMRENKPVEEIVETLKTNGEANTGLTFIWMPVLFQHIGGGGRFLAIAFFFCLSLAGLSSLISLLELSIHTLTDFGVRRVPATVLIGSAAFLLGSASATDLSVLVNQDAVWGYALILCGCFLVFMVMKYDGFKFRRVLYNEYGMGDWSLPWVWVIVVL
jgi:SNF family Na+-dependent transporter